MCFLEINDTFFRPSQCVMLPDKSAYRSGCCLQINDAKTVSHLVFDQAFHSSACPQSKC